MCHLWNCQIKMSVKSRTSICYFQVLFSAEMHKYTKSNIHLFVNTCSLVPLNNLQLQSVIASIWWIFLLWIIWFRKCKSEVKYKSVACATKSSRFYLLNITFITYSKIYVCFFYQTRFNRHRSACHKAHHAVFFNSSCSQSIKLFKHAGCRIRVVGA